MLLPKVPPHSIMSTYSFTRGGPSGMKAPNPDSAGAMLYPIEFRLKRETDIRWNSAHEHVASVSHLQENI